MGLCLSLLGSVRYPPKLEYSSYGAASTVRIFGVRVLGSGTRLSFLNKNPGA